MNLNVCVCFSDTISNTLNVCVRAYDVPVLITFFVTSPNGQIVSHPNTRWFLPSLDTTGLNPISYNSLYKNPHSCTLFITLPGDIFMRFHTKKTSSCVLTLGCHTLVSCGRLISSMPKCVRIQHLHIQYVRKGSE